MNIDESTLSASLEAIAGERLGETDLDVGLDAIVRSLEHTFGATGAGVMLLDEGQDLRYASATDDRAQTLESVQASSGHGPCVDSLIDDKVVRASNLSTDPRWPDLAVIAASTGICAVLGVPVHVGGVAIGSLNVYFDRVHEWDESEVRAIESHVHLLEQVVGLAMTAARQSTLVDQLTHALEHRVAIERAVGLLMGRDGVDAVTAFDMLRRSARSDRRKVAELAAEVLDGRHAPPDQVPESAV